MSLDPLEEAGIPEDGPSAVLSLEGILSFIVASKKFEEKGVQDNEEEQLWANQFYLVREVISVPSFEFDASSKIFRPMNIYPGAE